MLLRAAGISEKGLWQCQLSGGKESTTAENNSTFYYMHVKKLALV